MAKDIRYGWRNLLRTPGFTIVAVIALALGIGANTAIFSVVNAVLLRPLAYRDPERLVTHPAQRHRSGGGANYIDWRDQSRSFEAMAAAEYWSAEPHWQRSPQQPAEHPVGLQSDAELLPMLGVEPLLGRLFFAGKTKRARSTK